MIASQAEPDGQAGENAAVVEVGGWLAAHWAESLPFLDGSDEEFRTVREKLNIRLFVRETLSGSFIQVDCG